MLQDIEARRAKPKDKPYKLADDRGMYLLVTPQGGKLWRMNYRIEGKQKTLSFGQYPDVTLADARSRRDDARRLLAQGIDPGAERKATKTAERETFEAIAREWHTKFSPSWSQTHAKRVLERLENHIFPYLGGKPVSGLTAPIILAVLRRLEDAGKAESAHRIKGIIGQVMRYAVASGRAESDPTQSLRGALAPVSKVHHPALLEPQEIGKVLRILHGYSGTPAVRAALRLGPLVFVRPGELRTMKWEDLDIEAGEWRFTLSKTGTPHIVPLSALALEIIEELRPLTGRGVYVMPSARSPSGIRPMSEGAVLGAYRALGITKDELVGHGWRATARTLLVEKLNFRVDIVEQQLGHIVRDPLGRAYNRTTFLDERKAMMETWSRYLEGLRTGDTGNVVPIGRKTDQL
ncbi:tyrosine-type recombinase/integrase [Methylococcus capsulatus]|uniref:tyrosine-type recombinase/integrase n=1 Tax=Methylococcus capsulatus TaxID=414 RepID=UPI001C52958E|nr:integrase arm-type DNA-binding domain-containing protein [Methylococcus capsulatus]QXP89103.1 integrase arm-type DNA-binding domain-containing protein [Methylococcus capsulatus]